MRRVRMEPAPGEDPADRVRTVRSDEAAATRPESAGDVRLSRLHARLRADEGREVPDRAQADRAADEPHAEASEAGVEEAATRGYRDDRAVAGAGAERLAELPCRTEQLPGSATISPSCTETLDEAPVSPLTDGRIAMETTAEVERAVLSTAPGPPPVAAATIRRQALAIGAACLGGHLRICAGGGAKAVSLPQWREPQRARSQRDRDSGRPRVLPCRWRASASTTGTARSRPSGPSWNWSPCTVGWSPWMPCTRSAMPPG